MFRVAINLSNSYFRRKAAERKARERLGSDLGQSTPDISDAVAVRQLLAGLPRRQRAVLVLRYYADLSVREVAEVLDIPEGTVKTHTSRGLKVLRKHIDPIELKEVPNVG